MTRLPYVTGFAKPDARGPAPKAVGKALRERAPRSAHSRFTPDAGRPDAVTTVEESNAGRLPELVPIRVGRMATSPFAFLRGTAGLMAYDLMTTPVTGIGAQICGDAHAANFGLYGDARGKLVMDLNDFDETLYGPWEWDLKRLVASLVLAGREAGASEEQCREAARDAVGAYRRTMRLLAGMPAADAWNAIADEELVSHADARDLLGTLERVVAKARKNTSARFAAKATEEISGGGRRFVDAPPVLRRIPDAEAAAVVSALADYLDTLPEDRLPLLARYEVQDVAFRVVGTGSVGLRSYVVLLLDHRGQPLVLQVKEAKSSALTPYVEKAGFPAPVVAHEGRRIVRGQRHMQVVSDSLLGWTTVYEPHAGSGRGGGDAGEQVAQARERGLGEGRGEEGAEGRTEQWTEAWSVGPEAQDERGRELRPETRLDTGLATRGGLRDVRESALWSVGRDEPRGQVGFEAGDGRRGEAWAGPGAGASAEELGKPGDGLRAGATAEGAGETWVGPRAEASAEGVGRAWAGPGSRASAEGVGETWAEPCAEGCSDAVVEERGGARAVGWGTGWGDGHDGAWDAGHGEACGVESGGSGREGHGGAWGVGRGGAESVGRGGAGSERQGEGGAGSEGPSGAWGQRRSGAWGGARGEGEPSGRWRAERWAEARHERRGGGRGEGAGRPYQVRQFRNRKGSVDPAALAGDQIDDYARMTGALLARAHAHSADPRVVAGYCGKGEALDEALADFAVAYADRTEADHAELVAAIRAGRIAAETGV
ncbi:DUF2252 domain-containing protein [Streptomyces paromomycinus]|uniref:DUF2252 domain-containing protein n=1 Tax=Streptomyces paromomycinus TaxID=92743 RepID=A0A401W5C8_STREY|nr:DUF2252 domain-containing protein [Streptomyces paromomycinus]GCD44475.1 hypothetical protein GKJPGBOP_04174 [Streptomyces paromomycinus]